MRRVYLDHIAAKYQRVPTDQLPPLLGDPTPGPIEDGSDRPLSQREMDEALRLSADDQDPQAFNRALNYIRTNRVQMTQYGAQPNRLAGGPYGPPQSAPGGIPYGFSAAPSANGNGRYWKPLASGNLGP